jgi:hypothetical protein
MLTRGHSSLQSLPNTGFKEANFTFLNGILIIKSRLYCSEGMKGNAVGFLVRGAEYPIVERK